ncbi:MAG: LysR family transcriptional regulator [Microbacteriaceae bacterium]
MASSALDIHTLRVIRAIADTGSITAAAHALGFSQPAVSQQLSRVAQRLGVPLVIRSGRGIQLTAAGQAAARHAVTILSAIDAAEGELADLAGLGAGSLRIAAFPTASSTVIPHLLGSMAAAYPAMKLSYIEAEPLEALSLLREGQVDLAITFRYPEDPTDPHVALGDALTLSPLFVDQLILAARVGDPALETSPLHLNDLAQSSWIAGCPQCRGNLLDVCQSAGFTPAIAHETDNSAAVLGLVENGLGVALLPRLALASVAVPEGVEIHTIEGVSARTVYAVALTAATRVPSIAAAMHTARRLDTTAWRSTGTP